MIKNIFSFIFRETTQACKKELKCFWKFLNENFVGFGDASWVSYRKFLLLSFFSLRNGIRVGWPERDKVTPTPLTSLLNLSGLLYHAKTTPHITRGSKKENYPAQVSPFSSSRLRKTSLFCLIWIYIKFSLRISIAWRQRKSLFCVCF